MTATPPPGYGPPQVPAGYELKKKRHRGRNLLIGLVLLVALIVIISKAAGGSSPAVSAGSGSSTGGTVPGTDTIVYSLTSDASTVSATYSTFTGSGMAQAQDNNAAAPWTKTVTAQASWVHSFSLIGQMNPAALASTPGGKDGTTITCQITVNGKVIAKQTSTGQYAAVTCAAS